jgi:hypothetical protein
MNFTTQQTSNACIDSSKSINSKNSNSTNTRKASIDGDANRSLGRSSNGGRKGSNERGAILKLKINKNKVSSRDVKAS